MHTILAFSATLLLVLGLISHGPAHAQSEIEPQSRLYPNYDHVSNQFGSAVEIDGNYAIVGAPKADKYGAAYVFERKASNNWMERAKLTAFDGITDDLFGDAVSISGNTAMVGAPLDDDAGDQSGAVYVFDRQGESWVFKEKLLARDISEEARFGSAVSISGNYAIISAPGVDIDGVENAGAAYIFEREPGSWFKKARLTAPNPSTFDAFAWSVSIDGNRAVIGAPLEDHLGSNAGLAFLAERSGSAWSVRWKLMGADTNDADEFGRAVSISGDYVVIGAPHHDVNGLSSGAAYVFQRQGATWPEKARLTPSDGVAIAYFGNAVSNDGSDVVVGGPWANNPESNAGSAYLFRRSGSAWEETIFNAETDEHDAFGYSVSISDGQALVGAPAPFPPTATTPKAGLGYVYDYGQNKKKKKASQD